jgi:hypothetical protein
MRAISSLAHEANALFFKKTLTCTVFLGCLYSLTAEKKGLLGNSAGIKEGGGTGSWPGSPLFGSLFNTNYYLDDDFPKAVSANVSIVFLNLTGLASTKTFGY